MNSLEEHWQKRKFNKTPQLKDKCGSKCGSLAPTIAIRLCDFKNLSQIEAAKRMRISQSTLGRILGSARKKIAEALIKGKAIKIKRP